MRKELNCFLDVLSCSKFEKLGEIANMKNLSSKLQVLIKRKLAIIVVVLLLSFIQVLTAGEAANDFLKFPEKNKKIIAASLKRVLDGDEAGFAVLLNAATKGNPLAQETMFRLYFESNSKIINPMKACKYGLMAYSFWRKKIVIKPEEAYEKASKAMKQKDFQGAIKNLRSSAFRGFGDASFQLAKFYLKGDQVEKNTELAGKLINHSLKFIDMAKERADLNECLATIRVITGAFEMHNMDHKDLITSYDESMTQNGGILINEGYLKKPVKMPTAQCHYESTGDISKDGVLRCAFHGSEYDLLSKIGDGLLECEPELEQLLLSDIKQDRQTNENAGKENPEDIASEDSDSSGHEKDAYEDNTSQELKSPEEEKKACFGNIRLLLQAVEMYNMDNENKIHSLDESMFENDGIFYQGGYLKKPINKPNPDCNYGSDGDLYENGKIRCTIHGSSY